MDAGVDAAPDLTKASHISSLIQPENRGGPLGLVLSGGGARGAFEVGVLSYIAEKLPHVLERIRVITGSSVGAVNGVYLASRGLTPDAVRDLAEFWRGLSMNDVIQVSQRDVLKMISLASLRLFSKSVRSPVAGVVSVEGLWRLVTRRTDWRGLRRQLRAGRFDAVAVAATDISSGQTHLFTEGRRDLLGHWSSHDDALLLKPMILGPHQVLASAAIPILFPPVRVHGRWYMDGGVRYNTPLSPALYFGAQGLIIISVRAKRPEPAQTDQYPGIGQMVGKLLDSVFLDRIAFDIDRLVRINDMIEAMERLGPEAMQRIHEDLRQRGRRPYRRVPIASVRPSEDLGALAAAHLGQTGQSHPLSFARVLASLFEDDQQTSGDAASFLLFDGGFASVLIESGWRDAAAAHDALAAL